MERNTKRTDIQGLSHALSRIRRNEVRGVHRQVADKLEDVKADVCPACQANVVSHIENANNGGTK